MCKLVMQTGRVNWSCKLVVQTLCANSMCKLVMQTGHVNWSCKLVMQLSTSACGELHERSWSSSSGFFTLGLGTWGRMGPRVGGMWQGPRVCGRVWGHVVGGQA